MKVLLLSNKDIFTLNIARCLSDIKAECHVFGQGMMWLLATSRYCRKYTPCDFGDFQGNSETVIEKISNYCEKYKISIILSSDYKTCFLLSKIRPRLKPEVLVFPSVGPDTLEILNDKWAFAQMLEKNNLPQPRTVLVENKEQLAAVDMGFPCLVKPLKCEGGTALEYVKRNKEDYLASGQELSNFPLIVQEFIPGRDIDLSVLAHKGKIVAWTMQEYTNRYTLQFFTSEELLDLGRRVVAAVNFEGVAHFDLRIDERDNSIKFVECNPRFWNSLRASWRNGVNFATLGVMIAEGKETPLENISKNILYLIPSSMMGLVLREGKISLLKNIPEGTRKDLKQMLFDPFAMIFSFILKRF